MEGFIHNIIDPNVNIVGACFKLLLSMFLGANELHSKGGVLSLTLTNEVNN